MQRYKICTNYVIQQIFCEVYPDVVEKYTYKNPDLGRSELDLLDGDIIKIIMNQSDYSDYYKIGYLKRLIKQLRSTDDDFRWLSVLPPIKRNETYRDKYGNSIKNKVRPYVEYKYLNIKASQTPELLEETNRYIPLKQSKLVEELTNSNRFSEGTALQMLCELYQDGVLKDTENDNSKSEDKIRTNSP